VDGGKTRLTGRPFVVTPESDLTAAPVGQDWAKSRQVERIRRCLGKICAREDGRRVLPNSMLHDLRERLFQGHKVADAALQLALGRHDRNDFGELLSKTADGGPTLFRKEGDEAVTTLLDALDLANFWDVEGNNGR
jgi:hypothetical protein